MSGKSRERERTDGLPHGKHTGPKGITEDMIEKALRQSRGVIAPAARALGVLRSNLQVRIANSERLLKVQQECKDALLDDAENTIYTAAIDKGDVAAAKWLLDRLARDRGFKQTMDLTNKDGEALTVQVQGDIGVAPLTKEDLELARRRHLDDSDDD